MCYTNVAYSLARLYMSFNVWDIFENILQMKDYKIKRKKKNLQKKGAGGDEKHAFSFTRPNWITHNTWMFYKNRVQGQNKDVPWVNYPQNRWVLQSLRLRWQSENWHPRYFFKPDAQTVLVTLVLLPASCTKIKNEKEWGPLNVSLANIIVKVFLNLTSK